MENNSYDKFFEKWGGRIVKGVSIAALIGLLLRSATEESKKLSENISKKEVPQKIKKEVKRDIASDNSFTPSELLKKREYYKEPSAPIAQPYSDYSAFTEEKDEEELVSSLGFNSGITGGTPTFGIEAPKREVASEKKANNPMDDFQKCSGPNCFVNSGPSNTVTPPPIVRETPTIITDTTPAEVAITSNAIINIANAISYDFSGTCSENGINVSYDIGGITGTTPCTSGVWSVTGLDVSAVADNIAVPITADHVDTAGNAATQATISVLKDTIAPATLVLSTPVDTATVNNVSQSIIGTCEDGASVTIAGDISASAFTCASSAYTLAATLTAGDGLKSFSLTQTDPAGNASPALSASYTLDTTVPTVTIDTLSIINLGNHISYNFSGTCSEATRNVDYDIGAGSITGTVVCSGANTWSVTGLDVSGIADASAVTFLADHDNIATTPAVQATQDILKDTLRPTPLTLSAPADGSTVNNVSQTLTGTCEANASLSITGGDLDGGPFNGTCSGAGTYSIGITLTTGDATKNFSIDQVDAAGNNMAATLDASYILDTNLPTVAITSYPPVNIANVSSYTFSGTCSEATRNVTYDINGGAITGSVVCSGANTWTATEDMSGISDNTAIVFLADHSDLGGNDAVQDSQNVLKDVIAPAVPTLTAPADTSVLNSVTHTLTGNCEASATVSISGAGTTGGPFTGTCSGGGTYSIAGFELTSGDGVKNFDIIQTDVAGNPSASSLSASYTLDQTAPTVTIDTLSIINLANYTSYSFSGTCSENGQNVNYDIAGGTVSGSVVCSTLTWSVTALDLTSVSDNASVTFLADHDDIGGNSAAQASQNVLKDIIRPTPLTITSPADNAFVNSTSQTMMGTCETSATVSISGAGISGGPNTGVCSAGTYSIGVTLTAGDGTKNFSIDQTDLAGNSMASTVDGSYTLDTGVPTVTIDSYPTINLSNYTSYAFSGSCSEATRNISYDIGGGTITGTAVCTGANTWSVTGLDVSSISDNASVAILADHDDAGGNNAVQATRNVLKDTVAPATPTLSTPADSSILNNVSQTLTGNCEATATVSIDGAGLTGGPFTGTCAGGGTYSIGITMSSGDGVKNFSITQTDVAGNPAASALAASYTLDTAQPTVTIDSLSIINLGNHTSYSFSGTCSEASRNVSYNIEAGTLTGTAVCSGGNTWSVTGLNVSSVADNAAVVFLADHSDVAGNNATQASQNILKDTVRPTPLTLTSPADASSLNNVSQTMTGTCEAGATVSITGAGLSGGPFNGTCTGGGAYSISVTLTGTDGTKNFSIDQVDPAGNNMAATLDGSYTLDTAVSVAITPNPGPINIANESSYTVSGTCSDVLTNSIDITIGGSVTSTVNCNGGGVFSVALDVSGLSDNASVSVSVLHTDAAGNTDTDSLNVLKDTIAPSAPTLTSPADDSNLATVGPHTLTGTCEANAAVTIASASSELASASYTGTCTGGGTYSIAGVTLTSGDANKDFEISQTDLAGNPSVDLDADYILDTAIPTITIDSYPTINIANENAYTFSGSCSENGRNVSYDLGGGTVTGTAVCSALAWSATEDVSGISDNASVVILADHDDAAGNDASQASRSVLKDTVAPTEPTITSPADGDHIFTNTSITMDGACETGSTVEITGAGISGGPYTGLCAASAYSIAATLTAGTGTKNFSIKATDVAGNDSTTLTGSYEFFSSPPTIAITSSPVANLANYTSYTVSGTCTPDQTGIIDVDIEGATATSIDCSSGTWSTTYDLTAIPDDLTMSITANYGSGPLATDNVTVLKDTVRPTPLTLSSPADSAAIISTTINMDGSCEDGATVEISGAEVSGGPYSAICSSSAYSIAVTFTAGDGVKNWSIDQTDPAGNSMASPITGSYTLTSFFITNITSTNSDGLYGATDVIDIVVTFNNNINISGTPTITLDTGAVVNMSSNTATTITFQYVVGASDNTSDLTVTAMSPGTYIRDGSSNDAVLNVPIAGAGNDLDEQKDIQIDTQAPAFVASSFVINGGAAETQSVFLSVAFQATDNVSNVTEFCLKFTDNTQPAPSDPCWKALDDTDPGVTPSNSVTVPQTYVRIGFVPGTYTVYGFLRDGAGNISTHSSTNDLDQDAINYIVNDPPYMNGILVTDTATPTDPPSSAELIMPSGSDVHIKWNITDDRGLAASPINLYYTTDGSTYTPITGGAGLDNSSNGGCTIDEAGTTADDSMTGCFLWSGGAPSSSFFKIRIEAFDNDGVNSTAFSVPLNDTSFNVLAGNTDKNIGNAADSAIFSHNTGTAADSSKQTFVVMPNGDVYISDVVEGIIKIPATTRIAEVFLPKNGNSSFEGALGSAGVNAVNLITLDYDYNLWIYDYDRIRKIDLDAGTIATIIGGGGDSNPNNVLGSAVDMGTRTKASNHSIFKTLPDGRLLFTINDGFYGSIEEKFYWWNPVDSKVYRHTITGTGSANWGSYNPSSHNCRLASLYLSHDLNKTSTTITEMFYRATGDGGSCSSAPNFVNLNTSTWNISGPHPGSSPDAYYRKYGVKGMNGKIYALDHHSTSAIWSWNESTRQWDKILGGTNEYRGNSCVNGMPALHSNCYADVIDIFITEQSQIYFNDGGSIRTIDENGDVQTLYGQKLDFGDSQIATAARFANIRNFNVWDNGGATTVTLLDEAINKFREFPIGGNIETVLGDGVVGSSLEAGDNSSESLEGASEGTHFVVHPTSGDIFFHNGSDDALMWDRSANNWIKVYGDGGTNGWSASDGTAGTSIDWNGSYSPKPMAMDVTGRKVLYGENGYSGSTINNSFIFTMDFNAGYTSANYTYMLGQAGNQPGSGDAFCSAGTSPAACNLRYSGAWDYGDDSGAPTAVYYPTDNSWLLHSRHYQTNQSRIVKIKKNTNVADFTYLDNAAVSFDYYDAGATEYIFYCGQNGNLYKRNVTAGTETLLTILSPGITCAGLNVHYDSARNSLIFIFKEGGMMGIGEYLNP